MPEGKSSWIYRIAKAFRFLAVSVFFVFRATIVIRPFEVIQASHFPAIDDTLPLLLHGATVLLACGSRF